MNEIDRIERFFMDLTDEATLAEALPASVVESTFRWWQQVLGCEYVYLDADESTAIVTCAVFQDAQLAHASVASARLVTIDWWNYSGMDGALDLYRMCEAAARSVMSR